MDLALFYYYDRTKGKIEEIRSVVIILVYRYNKNVPSIKDKVY